MVKWILPSVWGHGGLTGQVGQRDLLRSTFIVNLSIRFIWLTPGRLPIIAVGGVYCLAVPISMAKICSYVPLFRFLFFQANPLLVRKVAKPIILQVHLLD